MTDEKRKIKRILVVDDEPDLIELYQLGLEKYGYTCLTASNGIQGIEVVESESVDLVISDYRMPKSNGLDLFRKTKAFNEKLGRSRLPFIIVTGFVEQDVVTALLEGVSAVHGKPVSLKLLIEDIKHLEETAYYSTQRVYIRRKAKLYSKISNVEEFFPVVDISLGGMQFSGLKSPFLINEAYNFELLNANKKSFSPGFKGVGKCVWQRFYCSDDGQVSAFSVGFSFDEETKKNIILSDILNDEH